MTKIKSVAELQKKIKALNKKKTPPIKLLISMGTCGLAAGASEITAAARKCIAEQKLEDSIEISSVGCMGLCYAEPTVILIDRRSGAQLIYGDVSAGQISGIIESGLAVAHGTRTIDRTWHYPEFEKPAAGEIQARIVLRNTGRIDPENIDEYIASGGYTALAKVLTSMKPGEVVETIEASGLRGRGGGGFPTGKKWRFAAAQKSPEKFIICNADEGDPGAFMDRAVLEGDPHTVLEAMAIGGYAIGARAGIVYVRAEYPLAVKRLEIAIRQAEERGVLGENLFGSSFDFRVEIKFGAGAFVCGEETALIHSIEGKRGEPTVRPPYPAVAGLWSKPSVVNNVETYASVCAIIRNGAAWFRSIGTSGSPGTKVFALAGKVSRVGLVEVPMGTSLREIIFGLGGGIRNGRRFKSVQTGGPSGGCITDENLDLPIDYEALKKIGSMMGSGGMIVMDEGDCMVNIARFYIEFMLGESCGKCTPCRIGTQRLYEMLDDITSGRGTLEILEKLKTLSGVLKDTALCGLGQTAPNPVLSTMKNFESEYMAHVNDSRCPAGVCRALIRYEITDRCVGCGVCLHRCPVHCISGERRSRHKIDASRCIKCGSCYAVCKFHAVAKV